MLQVQSVREEIYCIRYVSLSCEKNVSFLDLNPGFSWPL